MKFNIEELADAIVDAKNRKSCCAWKWVLSIAAILAVIGGIAYAVYRYLYQDMSDEFDEEWNEDDDDEFFEDEEEEEIKADLEKEAAKAEAAKEEAAKEEAAKEDADKEDADNEKSADEKAAEEA